MKKMVSLLLTFTLVLTYALPCWSQTPDSTQSTPAPPSAVTTATPSSEVPVNGKPAHTPAEFAEQGKSDARELGTGGAFTIGLVSGIGLGIIGTALAWGFQGEPDPPKAKTEPLPNVESRLAYSDAYGKAGKSKKRGAALVGGLIGTAAIVAVVAASGSGSEGE
ncbi:MAG TPA: hypothetical protein VFQ05_11580 [Candidatus Eisenbacteria bacterium]|nr:hypothetical protein [Candidatus Eisenbacteria bacterium]